MISYIYYYNKIGNYLENVKNSDDFTLFFHLHSIESQMLKQKISLSNRNLQFFSKGSMKSSR